MHLLETIGRIILASFFARTIELRGLTDVPSEGQKILSTLVQSRHKGITSLKLFECPSFFENFENMNLLCEFIAQLNNLEELSLGWGNNLSRQASLKILYILK